MNGFPTRTAVILTAIPVETGAVLQHLSNRTVETVTGMVFYIGNFGDWRVAVTTTGEGNDQAAAATERAIAHYAPEAAVFVGIAGGLKDVAIGDVVVAEVVYPYEKGKQTDERFQPRPKSHRPHFEPYQQGQALVLDSAWWTRLRQSVPDGTVFTGPVAAGEKVLSTTKADLYLSLRNHFDDALAVEMEGYGFLGTVYKNSSVKGLLVRGISDLLKDKSITDAEGSQEIAADRAAAVAFEILARLPAPAPMPAIIPSAVEIREVGPGRFAWTGAFGPDQAERLWEDPPPVGTLRIAARWSGSPPRLRRALLRLLCHARRNAFHVQAVDRDEWRQGCTSYLNEHMPVRLSGGIGDRWQAMPDTGPPSPSAPGGQPADDLAGQIEKALDEWSFNRLDEGVKGCLSRSLAWSGGDVLVEEALAERLLEVWDAWKAEMGPAIRQRFFEMLVSFLDDEGQPQGWVGIGPQTMDGCMVPATILALVVAECGDAILHPQGDGPLKPHCGVPGNLASQRLFGHCSGVQRVKGKPVTHHTEKLSQFPWRSRLVVLSGLESSLALQHATTRLIGRRSSDGRLNDISLARPVALAFESDFADALSEGRAAVELYLRQIFYALWSEQANYLKNISSPVPTEAGSND
ncbi:ABC-three component system protein [Azospirillum sp. sgz302134]